MSPEIMLEGRGGGRIGEVNNSFKYFAVLQVLMVLITHCPANFTASDNTFSVSGG